MFEPLLRRSISSTPVHPVLVLIPHSLPSAENLHLLHYDFCLSVRSACFWLRVLFIGLVLLLSWTGQKIAQVLTNNEPANAAFYF